VTARLTCVRLRRLTAGGCALLIFACQTADRPVTRPAAVDGAYPAALTPTEAYAGEVLAYLMKVVLGRAGDPRLRAIWAERGRGFPLELSRIKALMDDEEASKRALLVLDTNILGLSEVLYYYNRRLNQFKGRTAYDSVYPSAELLALRLLLLQALQNGQKLHLGALLQRQESLLRESSTPDSLDLAATGLTVEQWRLLGEVIWAEPFFLHYLQLPFIVASLNQLGIVAEDAYLHRALRAATYRPHRLPLRNGQAASPRVVIAVLPSLVTGFSDGPGGSKDGSPTGFTSSPAYRKTVSGLIARIRERVTLLAEESGFAAGDPSELADRVVFLNYDRRPFLITPQNADRVIADLAPRADLNLVILGKNVYRTLHFASPREVYPGTNRIYLDELDIRYDQIDEELGQIGRFILRRLEERKG
jgi:hypothetical protein